MGHETPRANQPRQGRNTIDAVLSFAALRLSHLPEPRPTADAVGYRSFAAPRLSLMPLKAPDLIRSSESLSDTQAYRFESATGVEAARAFGGSGVKSSPGLMNWFRSNLYCLS